MERELGEGLRQRSGVEGSSESETLAILPPTPGVQAPSHIHLHVSSPPRTEHRTSTEASSSSTSLPSRPWISNSSFGGPSAIPPPPPLPAPEVRRDVVTRSPRASREVGVQTQPHGGLTEAQLAEIEIITTNARTPGALHLFPHCHALRNVAGTNRRMFCRYCLQALRERGTR